MKNVLTIALFAIFATGLISCATADESGTAPEQSEAANKSVSNTTENAPGTTPDVDTKGKSDADK